MASSCGASSGSSLVQSSGSEKEMLDQRKRKRMISNKESAKRSRMRKQKQMDDLTAQVCVVGKENQQIITSINVITQNLLKMEGENWTLRARVGELSHRLSALNEIISFLTPKKGGSDGRSENRSSFFNDAIEGCSNPPTAVIQPFMAEAFQY